MPRKPKSEASHIAEARARLLQAALPHVAFDGWSEAVLALAAGEAGVGAGLAKQAFPRGGIDLALAFHRAGDAALAAQLASADLSALRYSEKVAEALWQRVEIARAEREAVRRGVTLFALPVHAGDAARALWHTADTIWLGLGDNSRDFGWYSKRAMLAAVWSAVLLYWLGDESPGAANTRAFIDRRIGEVMRFEGWKAKVRDSGVGRVLARGPGRWLDRIAAPGSTAPDDLPGKVS